MLMVSLKYYFILLEICFYFLEDAQKKNPFPCPCSYRTALTYYLDLTSMPNTQILKDLAQYATDENEKGLLTLMGSYSDEGRVRLFFSSIFIFFFNLILIRLNIKNGY